MPVIATTSAHVYAGLVHSTDVLSAQIPITEAEGSTYETLLAVTIFAEPGDILDVTGRARITCEEKYAVAVDYFLWWMRDADDAVPQQVWEQFGELNGDYVWRGPSPANRQRLPMHISDCYEVPADWPAGHQMTIGLRADAHSTLWQPGDYLAVDAGYGGLTVRRWTLEAP